VYFKLWRFGGQIINLCSTLYTLRNKNIKNIFINDTYFDIASPICEENYMNHAFPDHLFSFLDKYKICDTYNIKFIHLSIPQIKQIFKNKCFFGETPYILSPLNDKNLGLNDHNLDKYLNKKYNFSSKHNYGVYHNIKDKEKAIEFYKKELVLSQKFENDIQVKENTIFIGIRRGDYVKLGWKRLLKDAMWYIEKINEIIKTNSLKNTSILVSTQDWVWYDNELKQLFNKKWKVTLLKDFSHKEPYKYLEIMKKCTYFICVSSQFYRLAYLLSNIENKMWLGDV